MSILPSRIAVICVSLRVFPSMASDPWIVRMRLMRRKRKSRAASSRTDNCPTASAMRATSETMAGVRVQGGW